ncbi:MAG: M48 family metalloprotease [Planctomycetes bacterium]|nr:M48 family metalloprotease [Planctomycetota bacterium]
MRLRLFALAIVLSCYGCAAPRAGERGAFLSGSDHLYRNYAGLAEAARLESACGGCSADAAAQCRLEETVQRVAAVSRQQGTFDFRILRSTAANAYSLPGPRIYLTQGLYERLERDDLLAAAVAHEIAHLEAGDSRRQRRGPQDGLEREIEADRRAAELLAAAGLAPKAMLDLLAEIREELRAADYEERCARLSFEAQLMQPAQRARPPAAIAAA